MHTATGVLEAMAIIGEIEMDSICSDLEMKDGTGLDILYSLRKNHIEIPFILMSGKDDCFEIKIAKCYGAVFISKTSSDITVEVTEPLRFFFCRFLSECAAGLFLLLAVVRRPLHLD